MPTLTHKIKIDPTCKQEVYFRKACGISRFTWNWALAKWDEKYKAGEFPTIDKAMKYRGEMQSKGFKDCFVVKFKDGKRMKN